MAAIATTSKRTLAAMAAPDENQLKLSSPEMTTKLSRRSDMGTPPSPHTESSEKTLKLVSTRKSPTLVMAMLGKEQQQQEEEEEEVEEAEEEEEEEETR